MGTRDTGLVTVDNLVENPARQYAGISKLGSRKHFDGLSQSLESKRDQKRRNLLKISASLPSSGWIFQKVLAEIVQKDLILSQKALISNGRSLGFFAPTSMGFTSKDSKLKDLSCKLLKFFTSDFSLLAKRARTFVLQRDFDSRLKVSFCLALKKHASSSSDFRP